MKKHLAIALSRTGRLLSGRDNRGDVSNVHCKANQNCHYESPLYNEYIIIIIIIKL
jgi:hypothetical protein